MTNTKLAEALRRLVNTFPIPVDGVAQADRASLRLALLTAREALAAHDAEQAAQAVPVAYHLSPTDIYDFAGWLTTRPGCMSVGGAYEAGPMAEAVAEYLRTFPERFADTQPPAAPAPEAPPDTDAVTACWQDFGRTEEFRRAVKWLQDGEIPGALFVAFRAGLRAASPKSLCDCGKKPAAECDKWEPGCDLGQSPEHARVVRVHVKAQAAGQDERAAFGAWFRGFRHGWKSEKDVAFDAWQARAALVQRQPLTEQQIMDGWRDECPPSASLDVFTDGVMFAERAHGIGATTGEQNK